MGFFDDLDSSKISVVSAKKVDKQKLLATGDSDALKVAPAVAKQRVVAVAGARETKCNGCCMLFGGMMSMGLSLVLCAMKTSYFLFTDRRIVNFTVGSVARHVAWIAMPGTLCGATLHMFLSEAMWSNRRNTWGMAWVKAVATNTLLWGGGIATGTFLWRRVLRSTRWSRFYYRYPIPTEKLELRLIENPNLYFTGMGWTYWLLGTFMGQFGYACCAALCVYQNRVHFLMSPVGPYAKRCVPRWRREQIARGCNYELSPTQ